MARPARVRMRSRKPCVFARRRLFGWKVRLLTIGLHHIAWRYGASPWFRLWNLQRALDGPCTLDLAPVDTRARHARTIAITVRIRRAEGQTGPTAWRARKTEHHRPLRRRHCGDTPVPIVGGAGSLLGSLAVGQIASSRQTLRGRGGRPVHRLWTSLWMWRAAVTMRGSKGL